MNRIKVYAALSIILLIGGYLSFSKTGISQESPEKNYEFVIEPQFMDAKDFSEGLAAVIPSKGWSSKWGFINKEGKFVIEPQFGGNVTNFNNGFARTQIKLGPKGNWYWWTFINRDGEEVSEKERLGSKPTRGLTAVKIEKKWGYKDREEKIVINPQFKEARDFYNGLGAVKKDKKWGFINEEGKIVIDFQFKDAHDFAEELAGVKKERKWGFIDKEGKQVVECQYDKVEDFYEGVAFVYKRGEWGLIDTDGRALAECQYDEKGKFHEGLAPVIKKGKCGFLDKEGKNVIECKYDLVGNFSNGLAAVVEDKRLCLINKEANIIFNTEFKGVTFFKFFDEFLSGPDIIKIIVLNKYGDLQLFEDAEKVSIDIDLIPVENKDKKWGFIDREGNVVIDFQFDKALYFSEGAAAVEKKVEKKKRWGFIDRGGRVLIDFQFEKARSFSEGVAAVQSSARPFKWGFIDKEGNLVIDYEFEDVWSFSEGLAAVATEKGFFSDTLWGYIKLKDRKPF